MLQDTTLADGSERSARGFKISKKRVTLLATVNASGDFRLPLVVIHKYINPRALKHCNLETLPVDYYGQKKAWMDSSIFKNWFKTKFVPRVKHYLSTKGLPAKALLLMDNAPSHPSTEELCSRDGLIKTMFLPANTTSLIQPMDQGILYNLKRRYKRNLLEKMILYETIGGLPYDQFAKNLNNKDCIYSVANAWEQIQSSSLQKAWNKLLGAQASSIDEDRNQEPICINSCPDSELEIERFMETFHDHGIMVTEEVAEEWLKGDDNDVGYQELSDDEIISEVLGHADIESKENYENDEILHLNTWYPVRTHLKHWIHV